MARSKAFNTEDTGFHGVNLLEEAEMAVVEEMDKSA
jgi:hypothetical protein